MNDLEKHLNQLITFIRAGGCDVTWTSVLFVEDTSIFHGMPSSIPSSALVPMQGYVSIFDAHLDAGHSWINLHAIGIIEDSLLVSVELPTYKNKVPRGKVSLNLSRPNILVQQAGWDASTIYELI